MQDRTFRPGDRVTAQVPDERNHLQPKSGTVVEERRTPALTTRGPEVWVHFDGSASPVPWPQDLLERERLSYAPASDDERAEYARQRVQAAADRTAERLEREEAR